MTRFIDLNETGWTKEIWSSCKLAKRVHHGGHTDPAEEGNGCYQTNTYSTKVASEAKSTFDAPQTYLSLSHVQRGLVSR